MNEIPNDELTITDVPASGADWNEIGGFALSFDGYRLPDCAEIANARRHGSLTDLRACLFFEQRRWRHFGEEPDAETMTYIRDLVERIRDHVERGDVD